MLVSTSFVGLTCRILLGCSFAKSLRSPRADIRGSTGAHSYVSFAFSEKKGVYMTMYYSVNPKDALVAL